MIVFSFVGLAQSIDVRPSAVTLNHDRLFHREFGMNQSLPGDKAGKSVMNLPVCFDVTGSPIEQHQVVKATTRGWTSRSKSWKDSLMISSCEPALNAISSLLANDSAA